MNNDEVTIGFRTILKRMNSNANRERYNNICKMTSNEDEERIWTLCSKFWPSSYKDRTLDIDKYTINSSLDHLSAQRYLSELEELLDKLGWAK